MKLVEVAVGAGGLMLVLGAAEGLGTRGRSRLRLWAVWMFPQGDGGGSPPNGDRSETGSDPGCPQSPFAGLGSPAGLLGRDVPWGGIPPPGMAAPGLMDKHRSRHFPWHLKSPAPCILKIHVSVSSRALTIKVVLQDRGCRNCRDE